MGKEKIEDKRDSLSQEFKSRMDEWLSPATHPHVRWSDVADARQAVIEHVHELAKRDQLETTSES